MPSAFRHELMGALLAALTLCAAGCSPGVDTQYGSRQRPGSHLSVNGVTALAELFERQGHRVRSWSWLSPHLSERADVIVWCPNRMIPPAPETRRWLENWLLDRPGRTLIYVGRDFDGGLAYWEKVLANAPAPQVPLIKDQIAEAQGNAAIARGRVPKDDDSDWFRAEPSAKRHDVADLEGSRAWVRDIDPAEVEIQVRTRFIEPAWVETLLASDEYALVTRDAWGDSQLIVVTNGSFLLNYGLVNREHRKLAMRLVESIGSSKEVYFLESGAWSDPEIRDDDPDLDMPTGLAILTVFPFNYLLLQLALAGVVFCWSRAAIFGRPRTPIDDSVSDFGQHVQALGDLLARTGDRDFARQRIEQYHQSRKGESGTSRSAPPPLVPPPAESPTIPSDVPGENHNDETR